MPKTTSDLAAYRRKVEAKHDTRAMLECAVESAREAELTLKDVLGILVELWTKDPKQF